jgi:hypothetical protein
MAPVSVPSHVYWNRQGDPANMVVRKAYLSEYTIHVMIRSLNGDCKFFTYQMDDARD